MSGLRLKRVLMVSALCATAALHGTDCQSADAVKPAATSFQFSVHDKTTIRANPTTQVAIRVKQWPEQTFLLWFPEHIKAIWAQWDPAVAHQDFAKTRTGGLRWEFDARVGVRVVAELAPRAESILLEVRLDNRGGQDLRNVGVQNCLHLSAAPDFACEDLTRIHIRSGGKWQTLKALAATGPMPMYYRTGFLESGHDDYWDHAFRGSNQRPSADHPVIVCTSKDGRRAVATASENYQGVFHNRMDYLRCIHSQQATVPALPSGGKAVFRQVIYFVDGGVTECVRAFDKDIREGVLNASAR